MTNLNGRFTGLCVNLALLEQLPDIVANGRKEAEKILEGIESRHRVTLQTREVVLPAKDSAVQDWVTAQKRTLQREVFAPFQTSLIENPQPMLGDAAPVRPELVDRQPWTNRLIYGDNLLAMAALLAGDENTPSLRGKVDLIYIDPPFDSKADYRTKVTLPAIGNDTSAVELEQKPTVIEQFAYSDTWSDGTASYLAMITPRLILMRELLADNRLKLQAVINQEPLALIEYWAVDPDYDGKVFRSVWQDYRGNTANDGDALRVVTQAVLTTAAKPGPRKVCVRVVDVFGFEAEMIATVGAAWRVEGGGFKPQPVPARPANCPSTQTARLSGHKPLAD